MQHPSMDKYLPYFMAMAAAEAAIGLAILMALYRNRKTVHIDEMDTMKIDSRGVSLRSEGRK